MSSLLYSWSFNRWSWVAFSVLGVASGLAYLIRYSDDLYGIWVIRRKLLSMLFTDREKRVEQYYTYLGDDIVDEFYYLRQTDRHTHIEKKNCLWLNCGYWKTARRYDDAGAEMAKLVARTADFTEESIILDVGCGFAEQDILWSQQYGCTITAIDLTPLHIQVATQRINHAHLDHLISVHVGNAVDLSTLNPTYTHLVALECAFHFETREKFLAEAFRVLVPGGRLILTDMIPKANRPIDLLVQRLGRWYTSIPRQNMYPGTVYRRLLEQIGFERVSIVDISEFVFPGFSYYGTGKIEPEEWLLPEIPAEFLEDFAEPWYYYSGVEEYVLVSAMKPYPKKKEI